METCHMAEHYREMFFMPFQVWKMILVNSMIFHDWVHSDIITFIISVGHNNHNNKTQSSMSNDVIYDTILCI